MKDPIECQSMADIRFCVDALDEQIVTLLGKRMRFMEAAARIKSDRDQVRDESRKAAVIARAQATAARVNFPPSLAAEIYERLVEASIAHELECFDEGLRVSTQ
jgi:isochorismate pyruvate lyase